MALTLYIAVIVGRLHEALPFLARFYLGKVTAALLIVAVIADLSELEFSQAFRSTLVRCYIGITVIGLMSVPTSAWPTESLSFFQNIWPQAMLMFVCVVVGFQNTRIARLVITWLVITTTLGAIQLIIGAGLETSGRAFIGGSSRTYDPNMSAGFFMMVLPYAMMFAMRPGKMRVIAALMVPTLILAMLKTSSRGGLVAFATLCVATIIVSAKRQRKAYIVLLGLSIVTMLFAPHADLMARVQDVFSGSDYNFSAKGGRIEVWKHGIEMMMTHPLLGVGIGAYEVANATSSATWATAHNAFIQLGAELGIGGFALFMTAIAVSLRAAWRVRKATDAPSAAGSREAESFEHALATASILSLVTHLSASIFLSMAYDAMTLFALAVPVALAMGVARQAATRPVSKGAPRRGFSARRPGRRVAKPVRGPSSAPSTA